MPNGRMPDNHCNVSIRIAKVDRDALREIAEREDRSISSLARLALQAVLAEKGEAAPRQRDSLAKQTRAGATCEPH
jgi:hypothetical protein